MYAVRIAVIAVRAVLTSAASVANRRQQDGLTLVDLTLQEGDKMTLAIRPPSNLPLWVQWVAPNQNLGEFTLTTTFYGYEPFNGVDLPMGYTTKSDWRNVDQRSGPATMHHTMNASASANCTACSRAVSSHEFVDGASPASGTDAVGSNACQPIPGK